MSLSSSLGIVLLSLLTCNTIPYPVVYETRCWSFYICMPPPVPPATPHSLTLMYVDSSVTRPVLRRSQTPAVYPKVWKKPSKTWFSVGVPLLPSTHSPSKTCQENQRKVRELQHELYMCDHCQTWSHPSLEVKAVHQFECLRVCS